MKFWELSVLSSFILLTFGFALIIMRYYFYNADLKSKYEASQEKVHILMSETERLEKLAKKELSNRKKSEVRTGHIAEKFAALMENFPYKIEDSIFVGMPIDFISFSEDGVHFVEVKSGKARLSKKQAKIKKLIEEKNVTFEIFRVNNE